MPASQYIKVLIGGEEAEIVSPADLPLSISYKLEGEDFQKKTASQAFNVKLPATKKNEQISNSYQNPAQEDLTPGQIHRNHKPASITAAGVTLLQGKAFLLNATHGTNPESYEYSFYGANGDWIIDLKEKTLFDFLQHLTFTFSKANILASFAFDGNSEALPYVFAPVKYRGYTDVFTDSDANYDASYLRPSISIYWLIYWGFKSLGYKVQSTFFSTSYFRKMVMPWTWGNFLDSDGTKISVHKFLAKSVGEYWIENRTGYLNLQVTNDSTDGGFDNNNEYSFETSGSPNPRMVWEYKTPSFGNLDATFSCQVSYDCTLVGSNSYCHYYIRWFHFDASASTTTQFKQEIIIYQSGHNLGREDIVGTDTFFATKNVDPGDKIYCLLYTDIHEGKGVGARANNITSVLAFQLEYFRIPIGGTIDFQNYVGLKKYKFLDFLGGVIDAFDLSIDTDPINKVVVLEPTHPYSLTNDLAARSGGYFNGDFINWDDKKDLIDQWKLDLFADYEKEVLFRFKDDPNDGILKVLQDRNLNIMAAGKYLFPDRFKAGKKTFENRFFAATTHYEVTLFKPITGVAPQIICLIPENISNTSNSEASNTFTPKLAYYKGQVSGVGGWRYDGTNRTTLPYMFAVNYKSGGENDPVLSYGDERIDGGAIAKGLLKRFFWQRLAIMRNGQFYSPALFKLNNDDFNKRGHREYKIVDGQKYELIEINGYQPHKDQSTSCVMRKWAPVSQAEFDNTFPSADALALPAQPILGEDIKYAQLKCLTSDIPTTTP